MHPTTQRIKELEKAEYKISQERMALRQSCQHNWQFAFEEKIGDDDFGWTSNPKMIKHFECTICGERKWE